MTHRKYERIVEMPTKMQKLYHAMGVGEQNARTVVDLCNDLGEHKSAMGTYMTSLVRSGWAMYKSVGPNNLKGYWKLTTRTLTPQRPVYQRGPRNNGAEREDANIDPFERVIECLTQAHQGIEEAIEVMRNARIDYNKVKVAMEQINSVKL